VLVLKNLLRRKARTLLSLLGIAIGIAAIISFKAVARGFREGLEQYFKDSGAQMLVVNRNMQDPAFSRVSGEEQDFVRSIPEVEHLSRGTFTLASAGRLKTKSKMVVLPVFGRTSGERLMDKYRRRIEGRLIETDNEIMLGSVAAQNLGLRPGGSLTLFDRAFTVTGIYESGVAFETGGAILANSVIQSQLKMGDSIAMGFIYLKGGVGGEAVKRAIEERYAHLSVIRTEEFGDFYSQLEYIDAFVWVVSLISVIVGGLGVLNTMIMSVSERTREIGTLRAVGWSRALVLRLVLLEGVAISALGGGVGLGVGVIGAELLVRWGPAGMLETRYSPALFSQAFLIALALGFVGALYPAWQASRLSPIEALKYE
jgi:putative ABC transport system permease protein